MATYTVKRGDTAPRVTDTLLDASGNPAPLTGATVKWHMTNWDISTTLIGGGTVTGWNGATLANNGQVEYTWVPGDVTAAGVYRAEWQVTYASGAIESWPNDSYAVVDIPADLA